MLQEGNALSIPTRAAQVARPAAPSVDLLGALACSREVWLLQRYLDMSIEPESGVRKQDGYRVVVGVSK